MVSKSAGSQAPDGSIYVTVTDGSGNFAAEGVVNGATFLQSSSGTVSNASGVATLSGASGKTTYLSGFQVTGAGATAASVKAVTVTGLIGGTATYTVVVPAGATTSIQPLTVSFYPPIPASAANTDIVVTAPAFGTGNTNVTVSAQGYRL